MSKKFDVVIGNPPYQDELIGDNETKRPPMYHLFMDAAFEISKQTVLVTPARFLSNAGQTPRSWNQKILADEHLRVALFAPESSDIFPGTDIDGGIVVTYRDATRTIGPIGHHSHVPPALKEFIVTNVSAPSLATTITEHPCSWRPQVFADHPDLKGRIPASSGLRLKTNTFKRMAEVCLASEPDDGHSYVQILGRLNGKRATRWVRRDYLETPDVVDAFKVIIASADGAAAQSGRVLGMPSVAAPGTGFTQTYLAIGQFDSKAEAEACAKYVTTKFARAMLSALKANSKHNSAIRWNYVPMQDFGPDSDIDWSRSVPQIDQQLYAKYTLDPAAISFIETEIEALA
ncbi:Eco57I restriction-modification methylase domain-containing protein [Gordonia alkaliphila]|uniref:Eco57I restriction-modification methylase domain-containing protein n=1 Tax=Gordonia alkaliphila TaxID=1053547 RepID=UPI001FF56838|nr:Eco57I restriction-modification methylase domain-containing protein [Gordonia alkaliphila]MCK0441230.1 Eco57I restriction-modification methylase domain-containing protein [Gordonia alkaliphila]